MQETTTFLKKSLYEFSCRRNDKVKFCLTAPPASVGAFAKIELLQKLIRGGLFALEVSRGGLSRSTVFLQFTYFSK